MEEKQFDFNSLISPSERTARRLADDLNERMFENKDRRYHFKFEDIVITLNKLSKFRYAPNPFNIPWGDALMGILSLLKAMNKIGVNGTAQQQNTKKAVIAMLTAKDPATGKVQNKGLLNVLSPHKKGTGREYNFVNESIARRAAFDENDDVMKLCYDVKSHSRDS